jgi:hypothetical protein
MLFKAAEIGDTPGLMLLVGESPLVWWLTGSEGATGGELPPPTNALDSLTINQAGLSERSWIHSQPRSQNLPLFL